MPRAEGVAVSGHAFRSDDRCKQYSGGDFRFECWLSAVDALVSREFGVGLFDLADMNLRDAFEDGVSPAEFFENDVREEVGIE